MEVKDSSHRILEVFSFRFVPVIQLMVIPLLVYTFYLDSCSDVLSYNSFLCLFQKMEEWQKLIVKKTILTGQILVIYSFIFMTYHWIRFEYQWLHSFVYYALKIYHWNEFWKLLCLKKYSERFYHKCIQSLYYILVFQNVFEERYFRNRFYFW